MQSSAPPGQCQPDNEQVSPATSHLVRKDEIKKIRVWKWHAFDSILCLTVFSPSMLFYWRGIWDLFGVYIYPGDDFSSNWAVFGLGCAGYLGFFLHPGLDALINALRRADGVGPRESKAVPTVINDNTMSSSSSAEKHRLSAPEVAVRHNLFHKVIYFIATRFYMYFLAVAAMAYWRGVWLLTDYYLMDVNRLLGCLVGLVVCYTALLLLRCTRSLIFPPFAAVTLDTRPDLLVPSTRFQTKLSCRSFSSWTTYVADSMFTYYVIITLVVITWRSTLGLYDVIFAFENPVLGDVVSFAIGIVCCTLLFATETSLAKLAARWHGIRRLIVDDVITFIQFLCESFLWYGAWNLNAKFLIADPFLGGWVNHAIGTSLLMTLQVFSYVGSCGCVLDVPDERGHWRGDDKTTLFSTKYLRHFYPSECDSSGHTGVIKIEVAESRSFHSGDIL